MEAGWWAKRKKPGTENEDILGKKERLAQSQGNSGKMA